MIRSKDPSQSTHRSLSLLPCAHLCRRAKRKTRGNISGWTRSMGRYRRISSSSNLVPHRCKIEQRLQCSFLPFMGISSSNWYVFRIYKLTGIGPQVRFAPKKSTITRVGHRSRLLPRAKAATLTSLFRGLSMDQYRSRIFMVTSRSPHRCKQSSSPLVRRRGG